MGNPGSGRPATHITARNFIELLSRLYQEFINSPTVYTFKSLLIQDNYNIDIDQFHHYLKQYSNKNNVQMAYRRLMTAVECRLVDTAMNNRNDVSPTFVIFLLKNWFGYKDQQDIKQMTSSQIAEDKDQLIEIARAVNKAA